MDSFRISGCGTALVTPFKDGQVDYESFANLVRRQVSAGIDFLLPLGTTGETPCLTDQERIKVYQIARENAAGKPVIVGVGTNSLQATLANVRLFEPYAPDAYLVVAPYYNKPSQEGLYQYFKAIAEASSKPIILYNVPGRTGSNITAETTLRLAQVPNIVGIKEASGNYAQIAAVIKNRPKDFMVFSGNDEETLSLMSTGADGVISVASNIAPAHMCALAHALLDNKMDLARELHYKLWDLFRNCFVESNPLPVKAGLAYMGLIENELRLPLVPASESTYAIMKDTIDHLFE